MNKKYLSIQKMLLQFNDYVTANKTKLEANTIIWEIISLILEFIPKLDEASQDQIHDYKGITSTKKQKKRNLTNSLTSVANLLYNDCLKNDKTDEINNFKTTHSQLIMMSNVKLATKAQDTIKYCEEKGEDLVQTGVTTEMVEALKTNTTEFETYIPLPQEMKKRSKMATEKIETLGHEISLIFSERLNKVMESYFKDQDPELYNGYLLASEKENVANRKLAIQGTIMDKTTHAPVLQAHILIPEADIDHLCHNEKGGFRIKNLEPGTYQVEIKAVNYQSQTLSLVHNYGETNVLDVLMELEGAEGD